MHEWALAESIVVTALKVAEKEDMPVISGLTVRLGELQQIDSGIFQKALQDIIADKEKFSKDTRIDIIIEEGVLECSNCQAQWLVKEELKKASHQETESMHFIPEMVHAYVACPVCKSSDFRIAKGRGVWIDKISG